MMIAGPSHYRCEEEYISLKGTEARKEEKEEKK
jgi:hypothetical protein